MLIDWFTIGAQALNFLILAWLMKRFLYRPILDAIDAREKRIAAELADADAKKADAQSERDEFLNKNIVFDQQRTALLRQATDEVEAERHRLLNEARQGADTLSANRQEALSREYQSLSDEITRRTRDEVFAIARKALADLAGTSLETQMSEVFVHRLREMDNETKKILTKKPKALGDPVRIRSAFELPAEQRNMILEALNEISSAETRVIFETSPDVIGGIELTANGHKVAWSIAGYLDSMEKSVGELLKEKDDQKSEIESQPKSVT